jgi:DNA-directed RNA polymerase specialized sigma24 family protein
MTSGKNDMNAPKIDPKIDSNFVEIEKKELSQTKTKQHIAFEKAFAEILKQGSTHNLFIACTAALKQYKLDGKYDAAFVFNNTYIRSIKALDQGKEITNCSAWIRSTNFHIVQELSKTEKKNWANSSGLDVDSLPAHKTNTWADDELETDEQRRMRKAFATLSPLEQAILQFKIVEGLRWTDIQAALITSGFGSFTPNSLSTKKRRALQKLKGNYQCISV